MNSFYNAYNIHWWGGDYYFISEEGHVCVCPNPDIKDAVIDIAELAHKRASLGQRLPALFSFPQILSHRLRVINQAFAQAEQEYGYDGGYFLVYPIKVNQHRRVIETLTQSSEPLGLEAGSKAELMTVLAHAMSNNSVIVCNGYKDREYARLALTGEKLGHKIYIVIEKLSELQTVLQEAKRLDVKPRLGIRARLASQGSGKWQASGGDTSKFGLSAGQVLALVRTLKELDALDCLELLHFHLGSQMSNIRDIANGVRESARFYVELSKLGANIKCFDVGGGLGVDYEGTRSHSDFSVNYGLKEYANNIVWAIGDACKEHSLPFPTIFTESGRALTVYHSVLVSSVIGLEKCEVDEHVDESVATKKELISLLTTYRETQSGKQRRSYREWLHDSQIDLHEVHAGYIRGTFSLIERAWAERVFLLICKKLGNSLDLSNRAHQTVFDELQERLADKLYVNFSLFQSLPDTWGIDQLFPIAPIEMLNQPLSRRVVLLDITCDSDGAITSYINGDDISATLPFPEYGDSPPMIGFFMVGAYQEILGNNHNLFGDTEAVDVYVHPDGRTEVKISDEGDTVADMLKYVQLDPTSLLDLFVKQVRNSNLEEKLQRQFIDEFREGLYGYTYLEDD